MADRVQYIMDKMASTLRQIDELELLSKSELQQVVKKRTDFEYTLRRRQMTSDHFYSYLHYEINLDKLLGLRCARLLEEGASGKDNVANLVRMIQAATIKHICYIFDRAVRRFTTELELWNDYIAFLVSKKSNRILGAVFGKAVALHPKVESFWLQAASFELDQNQNTHASRALLQRALRYNPGSRALWSQYFNLELWSAVRMLERQRVLGLEVDAAVLDGAPLVVFKYAVRHVPDVEFACSLHEASVRVLGTAANALESLMKAQFGADARLQEYLICVRVKLALELQASTDPNRSDIKVACSRSLKTCLDMVQQFRTTEEAVDKEAIACGSILGTLKVVCTFLASHAQSPLLDAASASKRRRLTGARSKESIQTTESIKSHASAVSKVLSELQSHFASRNSNDCTQLIAECKCVEGLALARILLVSVDAVDANADSSLEGQGHVEWLRQSGAALRHLFTAPASSSSSLPSRKEEQQKALSAWVSTVESLRDSHSRLLQLSLLERSVDESRPPTVQMTEDWLLALAEHADLLVLSVEGARVLHSSLELLVCLRGFDEVLERVFQQIILLKKIPDHEFDRLHWMTELVRLSLTFGGGEGPESAFRRCVSWAFKQVDQRPSLFSNVDVSSLFELVLRQLIRTLRSHSVPTPSQQTRELAEFAEWVAERAGTKCPDHKSVWRALSDLQRVQGRHDMAQHLQWRANV